MASQGGTSRLAQMQMRFQQRQQQEREQRKIEMTGGKVTRETTETKSLSSSFGAGKVRQMFDERRQKGPGIDRSYPLKPIVTRTAPSGNNTAVATNTTTTTKSTKQTTIVRKQVTSVKQVNGRLHSNENYIRDDLVNGNKILSNKQNVLSEDTIDGELFPDNNEILGTISTKLPNVGRLASLSLEDNKSNNKTNEFASGDSNNNLQATPSSNNIKLKPVVTRKTAPIESKVQKKSSDTSQSIRSTPTLKPTPTKSTPGRTSPTKSSPRASPSVKPTNKNISDMSGAPRKSAAIPDNMSPCKICHRHFNVDRLQKHEEICERTATRKRKMYDASKHRVKGTEAEQYIRMVTIKGGKASAPRQHDATTKKGSNWRQKHEEFIQAIRAAKEVQAHLARGGKLSDLPPPPPSENPDYIQCPHCKRRFNEAAASRHIPKCADMLHNKPKPGAQSKQKLRR